MTRRHSFRAGLLALLVMALVAGCDGDNGDGGDDGGTSEAVSGNVSVMGIWTGPEQASFQAVIDAFEEDNPGVTVKYTSAGDQLPTQLQTAIKGGNPPDMATVGQPGLLTDLANQGALTSIDYALDDVQENLGDSAVALGSVDGTLYGFIFKAANKSTVWYNVPAFEDAGVEPPATWDDLLAAAETLKASGIPAYSIGADVGWPLTDLFENVYLRQAGPEMYDQLSRHEIPWTDESVKEALRTMAQIYGDTDNIVGGTQGALQNDFPTSVANVFSDPAKGAMIMEGDFVPGVVEDHGLEPGTGYDVFDFPSIDDSDPAVVGGGDTVITFSDSEATQAFVRYLTTAEAAEVWAERGGFATLNKEVDESVFPDDITRKTATAIGNAEVFRFDMSDLQPAAFGGTAGQGMWKIFTDFLANPDDVDGTAQKLETAAANAFG